ncbi:DUF551 domain-containing protein [Citrobacter sp. 21OH12SH02A-Citro]|uniref:DUF551 domain-containing protein n=1 Tax=Citrobacter sp. 21OH12SH02A-Citro TaxID=3015952 RepID=UPI0022F19058|nr:DUF551 domain-containing protein [Citrobacter sp. 21OH12SH02A-Citro]WBA60309.1 DUF551 domain-containing protein [Citrobacter sp. 21OH12SH02A-Citro]
MTTNHPAHGPVSLARLHQISEILSKAAAQSDGGNLGYAMADAVKVIDMAIVSFDAEPVGYFYETEPGNWYQRSAGDKAPKWIPLYAAPVVPPEIEPDYEVIKAILPTANPDEYACCIAADMWNACRAAMLQSGNSPVTPDGWIPVSERMPDDSSDVLCTAEFDGPGDWRRKVGYWHEGKWVVYGASWTPTHWMPLPQPPMK